MVEQRDTRLRYLLTSCKHLVLGVEQTDLHAEFLRMYEEAKEFGKLTKSLIDRVKGFVQPDPNLKSVVLPPSSDYTKTQLFCEFIKETGEALKKSSPKIAEHYILKAKTMNEIDRLEKIFILHVMKYTLKPMEHYLNVDLEEIKVEFDKLVRYKKMFDEARNQLKVCKPEKIESSFVSLEETKNAFEKQANITTELLQRLPAHIDQQRIALRQLALGYRLYHEQCKDSLTKMLHDTKE